MAPNLQEVAAAPLDNESDHNRRLLGHLRLKQEATTALPRHISYSVSDPNLKDLKAKKASAVD